MLQTMKRAILILAALVAVLGLATPASATTVVSMDLEDLAVQADRAVEGKVTKIVSRAIDGRVYTFVTLEVERDLLGLERTSDVDPAPAPGQKGNPTLTVRMLGGTAGDLGQYVPGTPEFSEGEDVVLFLRRGKQAPEVHHLIGLRQSVYRVRETPQGPMVTRDLEGLARATEQGGETRVEESAQEAEMPLETLEARVRAARRAEADREIEAGAPERNE